MLFSEVTPGFIDKLKEISGAFYLMRGIKKVFDLNGILNPGKIF